ncbi:MAG: serine/threonine protein kinase [Chloroflexi bacterium]|nr:serine/threonine protein kinase [Chloroflexota bacterium]
MADRHQSTTSTQLPASVLWLARAAWGIILLVTIVVPIASVNLRYEILFERAIAFDLASIGIAPAFYATWLQVFAFVPLVLFTLTGTVLAVRRSDDWMALFTAGTLLLLALETSNFPQALNTANPAFAPLVAVISSLGVGMATILLYIFPNGRAVPRWTRWIVAFYIVWSVLVRPLTFGTPFYITDWPLALFFLWSLVFVGGGVAAQIHRYATAQSDTVRQQFRWTMVGVVIAGGGFVLLQLILVLFPVLTEPGPTALLWGMVDYSLYILMILPLPITLGIAIIRYRLWDLDIVINRGLVYGSLTGMLVVLMIGTVVFIQSIFQTLNMGQSALIAVAVSAGLFGLVFQPTRRFLQRQVDQRFYDIQVDYQREMREQKRPPALASISAPTHSLGEFSDMQLIGRGGMAEVYRAQHPTLNRPVAIKILPAHLADKKDFRVRFEREAKMIAQLKHPNIVHVYDYGEHDSIYYMVMEFIDGHELSDILQETPLTVDEMLPIIEDVTAALDYAHSQGVVHRDVKPSNIMLEQQGIGSMQSTRAVLMDFGIARIVDRRTQITMTGMIGTFDYMAPEQISESSAVDRRADVYALGVMCYEILTGRVPFKANNPGTVLLSHMTKPAPNPREQVSSVPEGVASTIIRAMAKNPDHRYDSAGAFYEDLLRGAAMLTAAD